MRKDVLIATTGRETIGMVMSQFLGREVDFTILDSGEIPIVNRVEVLTVMDALRDSGCGFSYQRANREGIGRARAELIKLAKNKRAIMVDDDIIAPFDTISLLMALTSGSFHVPCCLIAADYLGVKYLDRSQKSVTDMVDSGVPDHVLPYFRYKENATLSLGHCGTQLIEFDVEKAKSIGILSTMRAWKKDAPREDTFFTKALSPGELHTGYVCYHLEHGTQRREWSNADEVAGYADVLAGRMDNFLC